MSAFADLLSHPEVDEVSELRGRFGFMAYHGGGLEVMTDVIAQRAAELSGASYYGVHQPPGMEWHIPSAKISPDHSPAMAEFLEHVDCVITVHGYGRRGLFTSLLVGGTNRELADHIAPHLRRALPAYDIRTDLDSIPRELRGQHPANPVNLPRHRGVQLELPPRVRGSSPLWWDWEGPGLTPHTESLITALADAAVTWSTQA
jgi:phage replication-related protein YjqB (UPF0714/DUF867 family)